VQVALDDGTLLNVRILETELGANLELAWKAVLEESSSYTVTAVPSGGLNYPAASRPGQLRGQAVPAGCAPAPRQRRRPTRR
jgi:hypothetical protein